MGRAGVDVRVDVTYSVDDDGSEDGAGHSLAVLGIILPTNELLMTVAV